MMRIVVPAALLVTSSSRPPIASVNARLRYSPRPVPVTSG